MGEMRPHNICCPKSKNGDGNGPYVAHGSGATMEQNGLSLPCCSGPYEAGNIGMRCIQVESSIIIYLSTMYHTPNSNQALGATCADHTMPMRVHVFGAML